MGNYVRRIRRLVIFCVVSLLCISLAACETPEEKTARLTQHHGKTVAQVVASLGSPISRTKEQAVWERRDSYVVRHPVYETIGTVEVVVGHDNQIVYQHCIFTADLKQGRVVSSRLSGTGCFKMLPPVSH